MRNFRAFLILIMSALLAALMGCSMPAAGAREPVRVLRSGSLAAGEAQASASLYIDLRDHDGKPMRLTPSQQGPFRALGYRLVEKPSDAGHILHVNILARGQVSPERLKELAASGYGSPASFSGRGAEGLLADLLLVRRKVPEGEKAAHTRLKNIARRNALDKSQMRLGLYREGRAEKRGAQDALCDALLGETQSALPGAPLPGRGK